MAAALALRRAYFMGSRQIVRCPARSLININVAQRSGPCSPSYLEIRDSHRDRGATGLVRFAGGDDHDIRGIAAQTRPYSIIN